MAGLLDHSPADVLRWLLVQQGSTLLAQAGGSGTLVIDPGVLGDWPCFVGGEPDSPDNCVTIYDTQGRDEGRTNIDRERQEHPGIQFRIRSTTPLVGYQKAQQIAVAVDQIVFLLSAVPAYQGLPARTYSIPAVTRTTNVIPIGKDVPNTKRSIFSINAVMVLREVAATPPPPTSSNWEDLAVNWENVSTNWENT
jgi:hypothetical protein